jgi:hypothetical protein
MREEDDQLPMEIIEIPIRRARPTQPLDTSKLGDGARGRSQIRRVYYPVAIDRFVPDVPVERAVVRHAEPVNRKRSRIRELLAWLVGRVE